MEWVEVADGFYFEALTVHVPTNTVAYALLQNHVAADPHSEIIGYLTVQDFIDIASSSTHIVHADGKISGDPHFKNDFSEGINVL